jgi:hypothetical protein
VRGFHRYGCVSPSNYAKYCHFIQAILNMQYNLRFPCYYPCAGALCAFVLYEESAVASVLSLGTHWWLECTLLAVCVLMWKHEGVHNLT